jgi:putative hemolysin
MLHPRLRTVRLPCELLNKRGSIVELRIGPPITVAELAKRGSAGNATDYLRARTYMLGYRKCATRPPRTAHRFGSSNGLHRVPVALEVPGVAEEICELEKKNRKILENRSYAVFAERGIAMPIVLREIGRLRELTFRAVNEGTGKALDLDSFDHYYTHFVLWHKEKGCVTGGYRLAWTQDVLPERGIDGLYTSTLFRFAPAFFKTIGPAVELGRSFIRAEFQKDYAPLLLLWQAIACCVISRPDAPVLFGPVSISAGYSDAAIELIVQYLRQRQMRTDLTGLVKPRCPFRARLTRAADLRLVAGCMHEIEDLSVPLAEIDASADVPVLLRQYVRLGGRVAAFNVDRNFSNVLDGLLVVDLRETSPKLLAKYMGAESAEAFLRKWGTAATA